MSMTAHEPQNDAEWKLAAESYLLGKCPITGYQVRVRKFGKHAWCIKFGDDRYLIDGHLKSMPLNWSDWKGEDVMNAAYLNKEEAARAYAKWRMS